MKSFSGLETTLERVGRILSRKYDITVRCKGNECKTDGRTIWLPSLPENIPEKTWRLIQGELDHETAHIRFSDFNGRMKDFRQKWGNFGFDLLNIIEDVRVNFAMQKEYPGSRENILNSINEITQNHSIDQMPQLVRFLCGLFLSGMELPYGVYGDDAGELVDQFKQETKSFKKLHSTDEACEMAELILERLKESSNQDDQEENQEKQDETQESNGSESPQDSSDPSGENDDTSDEQDQSGGEKNSDEQTSSDQETEQSAGEDSDSDTNQNGDPIQEKQTSQESAQSTEDDSDSETIQTGDPVQEQPTDESESNSEQSESENPVQEQQGDKSECTAQDDMSSNDSTSQGEGEINSLLPDDNSYQSEGHPFELNRAIKKQVSQENEMNTTGAYRVYDPSLDRSVIPKTSGNGEFYRQLQSEVRPHVGALRQQLIRTLRARDARFWVGDQEEGRINNRKLHELINQGSNKVFKQTRDSETDSVAVTLLIDLSGSMSGLRICLARQVAILFAETLNQLRISSEIVGFTTENSKRVFRRMQEENIFDLRELFKLYTRIYPCVYSIFKAFDESFRVLKQRVPAMNAFEYTPLNDAILFAAKRIVNRSESRKIILVLTDGEAYNGNPVKQISVIKNLENVLEKCDKAGIECVAIGIQTEYVKRFFKECVVVNNLPELPKAFYKKFSELLRRNRQ